MKPLLLFLLSCVCSFGQRVDSMVHYMSDMVTSNSITTTTTQTNWTSGRWYTNSTSREWDVSLIVTNTSVLVTGVCGTELWVGYSPGQAATAASTKTLTTALTGGVVASDQVTLAASIPAGGYFTFTNLSAGVGNISTPRTGSGQLVIK